MYNWLEYKDQGGNSYYACGYCNNTVWERSDKCPFCGAPMNYQKTSGGKRFLSWVVLIVLGYIGLVIAGWVAEIATKLAQNVYYNNRGIFWIVLILGGTFGLGIVSGLVIFLPRLVILASQAICKSKKGLRYQIVGWTFAVIYLLTLILGLLWNTTLGMTPLVYAVETITWIVYNVVIAVLGKATAIEE